MRYVRLGLLSVLTPPPYLTIKPQNIQKQTLQKHYLRLIRLWPADPLRSVLVQDSLKLRMTQRLLPSSQQPAAYADSKLAPAPPPTEANLIQAKADDSNTAGTVASAALAQGPWSEEKELRQVNALYSLLENRYSNKVGFPFRY